MGENSTCSAQHFPDSWGVAIASRVAYHHNYMGVPVTEADCKTPPQSCDDDIVGSWCMYGMPCNKDQRCPPEYPDCVYCHRKSLITGYGKCHCKPGFCPVDGRCQ